MANKQLFVIVEDGIVNEIVDENGNDVEGVDAVTLDLDSWSNGDCPVCGETITVEVLLPDRSSINVCIECGAYDDMGTDLMIKCYRNYHHD